jgi:hypothetical protein
VLAVTGLGLALVSLAAPCLIAFMLYRDRGGATATSIGVNPAYYALQLASVALAVLGARKRSKLLPAVSILLAVIAAASMWFICSRTW